MSGKKNGDGRSTDERLRIGPWTFEPAASRLSDRGDEIRLEPRLADVLGHFARNPGRVVSKEELIDAVWEGRVLDEAAVARAVAELRRALGDSSRQPVFIETIPKRGYRLIAPVGAESGHGVRRRAVVLAAVLVGGLGLGAFELFRPPDAELAGSTPERGSAAGEAYRLATEALEAGTQAGNETAVVHLTRALALEPDFALARAGLAEAYSVRATWYGADADWAAAALVEASRAVALAPERFESHRALGRALSTHGRFGEAEASYRQALELRPDDAEIALRIAELLFYRGRWVEALGELGGVGSELGQSDGLRCEVGKLLLGLGYTSEGVAWFEEALTTRPLQVCANVHLSLSEIAAGRLGAALDRIERVDSAYPGCCDQILGEIAYRQGRLEAAEALLRRALESAVEPKSTLMRLRLARIAGDEAALSALGGAVERRLAEGVDVWFPAYLRALVAAELGDVAGALRWHREARARGYLDWRSDLAQPSFESLRAAAGFDGAIDEMRGRIARMRSEVEARGLLDRWRPHPAPVATTAP